MYFMVLHTWALRDSYPLLARGRERVGKNMESFSEATPQSKFPEKHQFDVEIKGNPFFQMI